MRLLVMVLLLALVCRWGVAQVGPRYVIEVPGAAAAASSQGQVQLAGKGLVLVRFQGLRVLMLAQDAEAYCQEAVADWPAADLILVLPASAGRYDGLAPLRALRTDVPVIVAESIGHGEDGGGGEEAVGGEKTVGGEGGVRRASLARAASSLVPRLYPMQPWHALELRKHGARLRVTALPGAAGTVAVAGYLLEVGNQRVAYRLYAGGADDEAATLAQRLPGADLALLPGRDGAQLLALNRGKPVQTPPAALTAAGYAFTARRR